MKVDYPFKNRYSIFFPFLSSELVATKYVRRAGLSYGFLNSCDQFFLQVFNF